MSPETRLEMLEHELARLRDEFRAHDDKLLRLLDAEVGLVPTLKKDVNASHDRIRQALNVATRLDLEVSVMKSNLKLARILGLAALSAWLREFFHR